MIDLYRTPGRSNAPLATLLSLSLAVTGVARADDQAASNAGEQSDPNEPDVDQLLDAERQAIAAITEFGGWVTTEEIDGVEFVVEVNMVYHNTEDGRRIENDQRTDKALPRVPRFTHLKTLLLTGGQASDEGLAHLSEMTDLERIYIWDGEFVTDGGVAHLVNLPSLEYIHLSGSAVTDEALRHLSQIPTLTGISMQHSTFTDQGLEHLAEMTQLTSLSVGLGETRITDEGVAHLCGLMNLEHIDLQGAKVTDAGLAHLCDLTNLKRLWFSGAPITDSGLADLGRLVNLEQLSLEDTQVTDAGLEQLRGLTKLNHIFLYRTSVTDAGAAELCEAIPGLEVHGVGLR